MKTIDFGAFSAPPGLFETPIDSEVYHTERLSYTLYSLLHDAYTADLSVTQTSSDDIASFEGLLDNYVTDFSVWLQESATAQASDLPINPMPALPTINSNLPAVIPNPLVMVAVKIVVYLVGKFIEAKFQPGHDVSPLVKVLKEALFDGDVPMFLRCFTDVSDVNHTSLLSEVRSFLRPIDWGNNGVLSNIAVALEALQVLLSDEESGQVLGEILKKGLFDIDFDENLPILKMLANAGITIKIHNEGGYNDVSLES